MKRIEFNEIGGTEVLTIVEREIPEPKEGEIVVKVKAAGLNRAEELFFQGQYLFQPESPSLLGLEASGIIEKVGANAADYNIGDEVCLTPNITPTEYGFLGEYVVAPVSAVIQKPKKLSFNEAASVWMTYGTAYATLVLRGGLEKQANQVVLISAASSGVGTAAIQMAKRYGAKIIATTRTDKKKVYLKELGADLVVTTEDENWVSQVQDFTDGKGVDIIIDAVADSEFLAQLVEISSFEATIVLYGALALNPSPQIPLFPMLIKGVSLKNLHYVFHVLEIEDRFNAMKTEVLDGLNSGDYYPVLDKTFSLDKIAKAYDYMASNLQRGKILIEV